MLGLRAVFFAHPPVEGARADDRDQFFDRPAQGFAKLQQPLPLFRFGVNLAFDPVAEDLVLFLQELDILRQFTVGARRDQGQQWVENLGHRGIVVTSYSGGSCTCLVLRFAPRKTCSGGRFLGCRETGWKADAYLICQDDVLFASGLRSYLEQTLWPQPQTGLVSVYCPKALLLMALYTIRSERQLCERIDTDLLFRWFLDMSPEDPAFDPTVLTYNRPRLDEFGITRAFFDAVLKQAKA